MELANFKHQGVSLLFYQNKCSERVFWNSLLQETGFSKCQGDYCFWNMSVQITQALFCT